MNNPIEQRKIERPGFCRGCDKKLEKGTDIIYTYSWRNRGQNIIFCMDCAGEIYNLVTAYDDKMDKQL